MDPPKNNKQWRHRVKVSLYEGHVPIKLGLISNMIYLISLFLVNISFHLVPSYDNMALCRSGLRVRHVSSDSKVVRLSPTTGGYLGWKQFHPCTTQLNVKVNGTFLGPVSLAVLNH